MRHVLRGISSVLQANRSLHGAQTDYSNLNGWGRGLSYSGCQVASWVVKQSTYATFRRFSQADEIWMQTNPERGTLQQTRRGVQDVSLQISVANCVPLRGYTIIWTATQSYTVWTVNTWGKRHYPRSADIIHPFVIGWSKYRLILPQSRWIEGSRERWEFPPFSEATHGPHCTTLTADNLPLGLCKETVKKFLSSLLDHNGCNNTIDFLSEKHLKFFGLGFVYCCM